MFPPPENDFIASHLQPPLTTPQLPTSSPFHPRMHQIICPWLHTPETEFLPPPSAALPFSFPLTPRQGLLFGKFPTKPTTSNSSFPMHLVSQPLTSEPAKSPSYFPTPFYPSSTPDFVRL